MTAIDNPPVPRVQLGRVLVSETIEQLKAVVREPAGLFFSVAMPVGFFALFASMWGAEPAGATTVATTMLATFGTFGVVGVTLLTPGIRVAEERDRGWLRAKRVSATPLPVTLAAKVLACFPHALGVVLAMMAISAVSGSLVLGPSDGLALTALLLVGAAPFALLGLAVGFVASPNTSTAVLMAFYIPSALASGLWMPLETLPAPIQQMAPALPTYHLAELALAQVHGGAMLTHAAALVGFTVVAAILASLAYRQRQL